MKIVIWIVYIMNIFTSISATNYCENSENQLCRRMCSEPNCPEGQCAMRNGNCCEYDCVINSPDLFEAPYKDIG